MKITQFKKMLAQYGSNIQSWDNVDEREVYELIESSEEASQLFKEAQKFDQALDQFEIDDVDTNALIDSVMQKVAGKSDHSATIHKFEKKDEGPRNQDEIKKVPANQNLIRGFIAIAACLLGLYIIPVMITGKQDQASVIKTANVDNSEATRLAANIDGYEDELETIINEAVEEEIKETELISLWALADASELIEKEQDIEQFLDEIFVPDDSENVDDSSDSEMDLWDLYLKSFDDTAQL